MSDLAEVTFALTDELYRFRLYLGDDTFTMIPTIKRAAQDACILFDKLTRRDEIRYEHLGRGRHIDLSDPPTAKRFEDVVPRLDSCYTLVNDMYEKVLPSIRSQIEEGLKSPE